VTQGPLETLLGGGNTRVRVADQERAAEVLISAGFEVRSDDSGLIVVSSEGAGIVEAMAKAGVFPEEVRPERSTLESVFLGLTGTTVR
jgi:hypothetical protein